MNEAIEVSAVVLQSSKRHEDRKPIWALRARVIKILSDHPKLPADHGWMSPLRFVGTTLNIRYAGTVLHQLRLTPGIVFRLSIPKPDVAVALEQIANDQEPELALEPDFIRPMDEPCVRVPLSVLTELRGQEAGIEYARRALVQTWSKDRRTGKKVVGSS